MPAFHFELADQWVVIRAEDTALLAHYEEYFRYYEINAGCAPPRFNAMALDLWHANSLRQPPATADRIAQTGVVSLWNNGEALWLSAGDTAFEIHPAEGRAIGYIGAEALSMPPILTNTYSLFVLLLLLRWRGIYHLHAAAVRSPAGKTYWLSGAQRSGKTTLATALGLAGWQPLADDSLLIYWRGEQAVWQPLRKAFHLGIEALTHWQTRFTGLSHQPRYLDRHSVAALEYFQTQTLAALTHFHVDGWLFPIITDAQRSCLRPLARSEALARLAAQSTFFPLWRNHTQRQFLALSQWATHTKCIEVLAGKDVFDEPERLTARLSFP